MKVLVLGAGMQGKAAVYDLYQSPNVSLIYAADASAGALYPFLDVFSQERVTGVVLDAGDHQKVVDLLRSVDGVICLLPPAFRMPIARLAVEQGVHFVDASYALEGYKELDGLAREKNAAILPECGLDPGIDLVLAADALSDFDEIYTFNSYGSGIPAPEVSLNPLRYKISWTFAGVLSGYYRPARIWVNSSPVEIHPGKIFYPENVHEVAVEGFGLLEAYPNGDVVPFLKLLGIESSVKTAGRYSMRWGGHTAFWRKMADLGFLSEEPQQFGDAFISPRQFIHDLLLPQLQYEDDERDAVIVRVEIEGFKNGEKKKMVYEVIDYRDPETGFLGMQRTVGFTAGIGLQMLLKGEINATGLLSPIRDIPPKPFFEALKKRGILVRKFPLKPSEIS